MEGNHGFLASGSRAFAIIKTPLSQILIKPSDENIRFAGKAGNRKTLHKGKNL